jgi:HAD superfamily hydrolase (TIGR01459 family)
MTKFVANLKDVAAPFDAFIIDLWGVLHDGQDPYPGAVECLEKLRAEGKKIILLSNAPRRAAKAKEVLDNIGFHENHYDHVLTSGEVTFDYLHANEQVGNRFYYLGPEKDQDLLDGSRFVQMMEPRDADFAVVTGFDHLGDPDYGDHMALKMPEIEACLAANLPLYCANPDRHVVKQSGKRMLCAGILAEYYEAQGGAVTYFGKPYESSYQRSFELLGLIDPARYCAIGDSLHTDIAGANSQGIYSVLVAGGILAHGMGIEAGEMPSEAGLKKVCDADGVVPNAVIPRFVW